MATSSSYDYSQTRDQIIADTLQLLGVIGAGETATANDVTFCSSMLNKMIKAWQAQGIHLWKETEGVVILQEDQSTYTLAAGSADVAGDDPYETTLTAAASSSATTLTVSSTDYMAAADAINVELDDGTTHHTTIVSVDSTTAITITSGLASAAASGNRVTTWTTNLNRPLNIINCRYYYRSGLERKMKKLSRGEWAALPTKETSEGPSTCFYYSPRLSNGLLYVWPRPNTVEDTLHITYIKTFEDFDAAGNDPDFPQEWLECITYNLATRVAPAYGISLSKVNPDIAMIAQTSLIEASSWDSEEGSIRICPNNRYED
jgi:hypothetical protein